MSTSKNPWQFILVAVLFVLSATNLVAQDNPIVFVTQVPQPNDFATIGSTFASHKGSMSSAPRGGDLYIRYPNGTLKNLTESAGYGEQGLQGAGAIAVRDPEVHWDANKLIFSMVIGAPDKNEQLSFRWQLYELVGLGQNDTPVITYIAGQPAAYNNIMPLYGPQDEILFVSDAPLGLHAHLYPQLDEYESTVTNTGIWRLDPSSGSLKQLDQAPSGAFHPKMDSFGRVVFSRWDHLQRDQQSGTNFGPFNYSSESSSAIPLQDDTEIFPEPLNPNQTEFAAQSHHILNQFFPWQMNPDGTELETLNHVGRQEIRPYANFSFKDDDNLKEVIDGVTPSVNQNRVDNLYHIRESFNEPGLFLASHAPEFGTHSAGQIISITGSPSTNAAQMIISHITHPDTAEQQSGAPATHSGMYRDPFATSDGVILTSHTSDTVDDENLGSRAFPQPRYDFRITRLVFQNGFWTAGSTLTSGISKNVTYWDPDVFVTYNGPLWELQPVEVVSRTRPPVLTTPLPETEKSVFTQEGVSEQAFRDYLRNTNQALIVSRDVTTRDVLDEQQPFNLRVPGGVEAIAKPGKVYSISNLQLLQGDYIRAYNNFVNGRRVLAKPLHALEVQNQPLAVGSGVDSVRVAPDGSVAAFVPATRPITWQLRSAEGQEIIRERYWITFQPGEVRVCASCHGVNEVDQLGNPAPTNQPEALRELLQWFKAANPTPNPTPIPTPDSGSQGDDPTAGNTEPPALAPEGSPFFDFSVGSLSKKQVKRIRHRKKLVFLTEGLNIQSINQQASVLLRVGKKMCPAPLGTIHTDELGGAATIMKGPAVRGKHKLTFFLTIGGYQVGNSKLRYNGVDNMTRLTKKARKKVNKRMYKKICKKLSF